MLPKETTPLTKFIRTSEGWLVVGSSSLLVILGAVGDMGWTKVGTAAAILAGVATVCRTVLKGVTAFAPLTGGYDTPPGFDPTELEVEFSGKGDDPNSVTHFGAPDFEQPPRPEVPPTVVPPVKPTV